MDDVFEPCRPTPSKRNDVFSEPLREDPPAPAWGHLTGEAVLGDTHLNRLTRKEFRDLFMTEFDIVQEEETRPDLGRRHLTAERRQALQAFDEQELFSNTVRFVLRKKRTAV